MLVKAEEKKKTKEDLIARGLKTPAPSPEEMFERKVMERLALKLKEIK
jgi:hypothetical protein